MNPLKDYPQVRKILYIVQWVTNLALGAVGIVLTANGDSPQWFVLAGSVLNFVWFSTGLTAHVNVGNPEGDFPDPDGPATNVDFPLR